MPKKSRRWITIRELNDIYRYSKEGLSIRRTAAVLGRPAGTIANIAWRRGIKFSAEPGYLARKSEEETRMRHRLEQRRYVTRKKMERKNAAD